MSDNSIIVVTIVCITTLGLSVILSISSYKRDRLELFTKTKYKDIENEVSITSENINNAKK